MIAQGGVKLDGIVVSGARHPAHGGRRQASRRASVASHGLQTAFLDTREVAATLRRPPEREARKALRPRSVFARFGYDLS